MTSLPPPGPIPPTGSQWTIGLGDSEATVVEVGGGLRTFTVGGRDVVAGYGALDACRSGRGQQLMPWPNRIRDGRYTFGGADHQLPVTEVPKHNASHGLVRWALWELVEHEESSVTVGYRLHPQPGWDHHLDLRTTYVLDGSGLVVTSAARNVGATTAPFGYGAHPYLSTGAHRVDDAELTVPATAWVEVDERSLPVATHPVDGTAYDFRSPRAIGAQVVDTAYTGVLRDQDGMWRTTLVLPGGDWATLWADAAFPWLQVFTGAAHLGKDTGGVAVEPMTCPADAFNSGDSLLILEPGEEWTGTWGVSAGTAPHDRLATAG
ncbi:MAG TPA: aldose 1-epimerase family protein [Intrasporangium sp.]|uniref:aldose 1-epimerase family protein n=1 Tax=Intrasporangium sp. TaxID=1925024 RepID=UPI002D770844|nr:aldose 1-epimerase family protein [Intrasporangium sp.]HET7398786.1 aldose 1-epimerase family protein [Intrasporangium sp.]